MDERIFLCRLLEKIKEQEAYCESIGVLDRSTFQGKVAMQKQKNDLQDKYVTIY